MLFLLIDGCDSLFCSFSHLPLCASVNDVFPEVHLNFAGGASMVLKPKDYLLEQNSIVSFPVLYLSFQFSFFGKGNMVFQESFSHHFLPFLNWFLLNRYLTGLILVQPCAFLGLH